MNENKGKKIFFSMPVIKMFAAGFVLFACAVAFTPSSGVLRTLPLFLVGGAVCHALSLSASVTASLSAVMTLCTYLASGRGVGEAVFYAAVSCLISVAGIYILRFINAWKKTKNGNAGKKCIIAAVAAFAVSALLCIVICGNVVSFVVSDIENTAYLRENYGKTVEKRYTSYQALEGEYRTYVTFNDGDGVYGNADECYISIDGKTVNDDVRNHYEQNMLYAANAALANVISGATWGYNITASDIEFEYGETLTKDSNVENYMNRVMYVVSFESIFHENEKDKFASVCRDTVSAIASSGIEFEKIVLCGGNASEVLFCLELTEDTVSGDVYDRVVPFDEKMVEDIGVTEMTILDYWKNK